MLLAGLTTGHKIGLAVVAAAFIAFALASSFFAPRRRGDFPGRNGLSVFLIASLVLCGAMLTAVILFGGESEAKGAEPQAPAASAAKTIQVRETEFKIGLPPLKELPAGRLTFVVTNAGKVEHDLVVSGPGLSGTPKTPLLQPGQTQRLTVSLRPGRYQLYCSVPGHRAAGMQAKISVG